MLLPPPFLLTHTLATNLMPTIIYITLFLFACLLVFTFFWYTSEAYEGPVDAPDINGITTWEDGPYTVKRYFKGSKFYAVEIQRRGYRSVIAFPHPWNPRRVRFIKCYEDRTELLPWIYQMPKWNTFYLIRFIQGNMQKEVSDRVVEKRNTVYF